MKVVGIIAEYNPFHKGHEYQIRYAQEVLGADYVVIAMSGDFVQRGAPALMEALIWSWKCRYRQQQPVQRVFPEEG